MQEADQRRAQDRLAGKMTRQLEEMMRSAYTNQEMKHGIVGEDLLP